jgi:hypothetical protein
MLRCSWVGLLVLCAGASLLGCFSSGDGSKCALGSESCACTAGGACDPGLMCLSSRCVRPGGADAGGQSGTGASGTGGSGAAGVGSLDGGSSGGGGTGGGSGGHSGGGGVGGSGGHSGGGGVGGSGGYSGGGGVGGGSGSGGAGSGGVSCGESGMYCKDNVLRSCATEAIVVDCATCKWIGPGTGSAYNTNCRDKAASCSTCDATHPWTGPGCYFGGGPAVCP